jgi:hypothetical protein
VAVVIIGNGKSRQHMDLENIKTKAWTFGCNALYRDFAPDYLLTIDPHVTHEILDTDYSLKNIVYLSNINSLPGMIRDTIDIPSDSKTYENEPTGYEFYYNGWGDHTYISWAKEGSLIRKTPWKDDGWGLSAGIQATRLAHNLYPKEEIYLIGFDIFGDRDNMYDGTNGYPSEGASNTTMTKEFIDGFEYLLNIHDDLIIKRVIDQDQSLENIPNVSEDELWQNLASNQKI